MENTLLKYMIWPVRISIAAISFFLILSIALILGLQGFVIWLNSDGGARWLGEKIQSEAQKTGYTFEFDEFHLSGFFGIGAKKLTIKENGRSVLDADNFRVSVNVIPLALKTVNLSLRADQLSVSRGPVEENQEREQPRPLPHFTPGELYFQRLILDADIKKFSILENDGKELIRLNLLTAQSIRMDHSVLVLNGAIALKDIHYPWAQYAPEKFNYSAKLDTQNWLLDIEKIKAESDMYALDASGKINLEGRQFQTVTMLDIKNPEKTLYSGFSKPLNISAALMGDFSDFKGEINASSTLKGLGSTLRSSVHYREGSVDLADIKGEFGQDLLSGHLSIDTASGLANGIIHSEIKDLSVVEDFTGISRVAGSGNVQARLSSAPPRVQKLDLSAEIQNLGYEGAKIESANISASFADVKNIQSVMIKAKTKNLSYNTTVLNVFDLIMAPAEEGFDLEFSGNGLDRNPFTISGEMSIPDPEDRTVQIKNIMIGMNTGSIKISGNISSDALDLKASLSGIDLGYLPIHPLPGIPLRLEGGDAALTGTFVNPAFRSSMKWSPASEKMKDITLTTDVAYAAKKMNITLTGGGKSVKTLDAHLSMPGQFQIQPFVFSLNDKTPLEGAIKTDLSLGGIANSFLLDSGIQAKGSLQVDARIGGTVADPDLVGMASLKNGYLYDSSNDLELNNIQAEASFDNSTVRLTSLTSKDRGNGTLKASGSVSFADFQNPVFSLETKMKSMNLLRSRLINAELDADLNFRSEGKNFLLSGTITPEEVVVTLPDRFNQGIPKLNVVEKDDKNPEGIVQKVNLDIRFKADNEIFVRGWGLDTELGGSLDIKGTAGEPDVRGVLSSLRGRYEEFGKKFNIERATLRFQGAVPPSPYLDVTATTQAEDIKANILITGRAEQPSLSLESVPVLPQDEILSRILFGTEARKISPFQAVQLAQSLRRFSGQSTGPNIDPLGTIRSVTGLDDITVDGIGTDKATVGAGKHISDKVYIKVEQGTAGVSGAASVDVEVTPNISVESKAGRDGSAGAGIFWERDY